MIEMGLLMWRHPLLKRIAMTVGSSDLGVSMESLELPCPGCGAEKRPRGLFESDPEANYATTSIDLSEDGGRVRIRRCGNDCSALRIAVGLNLELGQFEPWDQPLAASTPATPATPAAHPTEGQQRGRGKRQQTKPDPAYQPLRACVQAVLDAPEGDRGRVVRAQYEIATAIPGVEPGKARAVLIAAAKAAGASESEAEQAVEVWA